MIALLFGGAGVAAIVWLIAKQPLQIVAPSDFIRSGFAERAIMTQLLFALGWFCFRSARSRPDWPSLHSAGRLLSAIALFRIVWFDMLVHNPIVDPQMVGAVPVANLLTGHLALAAFWTWLLADHVKPRGRSFMRNISLVTMAIAVLATVRQMIQGNLVSDAGVGTGENYLYSAALLVLAIAWLATGISRSSKLLRVAGLLLLTVVTLKVFLIDAAALTGLLRILSFLGLGIALIGIGWAYGRLMGRGSEPESAR
jgi:uncharacterized membrane protein